MTNCSIMEHLTQFEVALAIVAGVMFFCGVANALLVLTTKKDLT